MKKTLLFAVILLMVNGLQSQTITFNKKIETSFPFLNVTAVLPTDSCYYANAIVTDSTGGLLTVASLMMKFDFGGNLESYTQLGTPTKSYELFGEGLLSTGDGNLVALGVTKDSIPKGVFIKYDKYGDTIFTREYINPYYPNSSFINAQSMYPDTQEGYYLLFGIDTDSSIVQLDLYLIHINKEGEVLNEYQYSTSDADIPQSLFVDSEGGVTIGGLISNVTDAQEDFEYRSHLLKLDSALNLKWEYLTPSNELYNHATSIHPTPDGGWVVGSGRGVEKSVNATSGLVEWYPCFFKLSASRQMEWVREFQSVQRSAFFSMEESVPAIDNSGYVGVSQITEETSLGYEILGSWLMKVSPEGDSLWVRHYSLLDSVPAEPDPRDIQATPDGGYIISGWVWPQVSVEQGFPPRYGWLLKVDEHGCLIPGCHLATSTEEAAAPRPALALYPNPARDFINFELRGARPAPDGVFRILDAQGRLLQTIPGREALGTLVVPVHDWAAGAYVVQYLEGGQARAAEQFLKVE